jgi:hypothetical protein
VRRILLGAWRNSPTQRAKDTWSRGPLRTLDTCSKRQRVQTFFRDLGAFSTVTVGRCRFPAEAPNSSARRYRRLHELLHRRRCSHGHPGASSPDRLGVGASAPRVSAAALHIAFLSKLTPINSPWCSQWIARAARTVTLYVPAPRVFIPQPGESPEEYFSERRGLYGRGRQPSHHHQGAHTSSTATHNCGNPGDRK